MLTNLIIIAGILIISLIGFNMTKHSFSVIEGMVEDKKKKDSGGGDDIVDIVTISKNQTEITTAAVKNLNIKEHRSHYNTIHDQMEKWVSAKMVDQVKVLSNKLKNNASMSEVSTMIQDINAMKTFKTALDDCSKFVDTN
jgi:hypothetical protein